MIAWTKGKYVELSDRYPKHAKIGRYLIAGGTAALTNLLLFSFFLYKLHIWYILAAAMAFVIAFVVSFTLQKYWTFQDHASGYSHRQMIIYLAIALINLGVNSLLMYIFVDYLYFHEVLALIFSNGIIAVESYFIYQIFVFRPQKSSHEDIPVSVN